eukprot:1374556-Rhodomonas_salina.2
MCGCRSDAGVREGKKENEGAGKTRVKKSRGKKGEKKQEKNKRGQERGDLFRLLLDAFVDVLFGFLEVVFEVHHVQLVAPCPSSVPDSA